MHPYMKIPQPAQSPSEPTILSTTPTQQKRLNQQQLKLYISLCQQPIPSIDEDWHPGHMQSHFKFYFNDEELWIEGAGGSGVMYEDGWGAGIERLFEDWRKGGKGGFIEFVEYWVRASPDIRVHYKVYDRLISESVAECLDNAVYQVVHDIASDQRPFKLKPQPARRPKETALTTAVIQKRLYTYFNHFAKTHNTGTSSTTAKTFDQLLQSYSTVGLTGWMGFVRAFGFDRLFEDMHARGEGKEAAKQAEGKKENEEFIKPIRVLKKQYLKVKDVEWNSSVHYFKNLFEKYCDNRKQMSFQAFQEALRRLFEQIYKETAQKSPSKDTNKQQNTSKSISLASYQKGLKHLCLQNQNDFATKLKSFGILVPLQKFQPPRHTKSYTKIKPKYLGIPPLAALSPNKLQDGLANNHSMAVEKKVVLPSLQKNAQNKSVGEVVAREKIHYTLEELMRKREDTDQQPALQDKVKQNQVQTKTTYKPSKTPKSTLLLPQQTPAAPPTLPAEQTPQQQPDQYLSKYLNKSSSTKLQASSYVPREHNVSHQYSYMLGHNTNLLRRIDERIEKVQNKMR